MSFYTITLIAISCKFDFKGGNDDDQQIAGAKKMLTAGGKGKRRMVDTCANPGAAANVAVEIVKRKMQWIHVDIVKGGKLRLFQFRNSMFFNINNRLTYPLQVSLISLKQVKKNLIVHTWFCMT